MILSSKNLIKIILEELEKIEKWKKERGELDKKRVYDDSYKTYTNPRQEKDKAVAEALSLERLQVEQKRRKEKEDKEKQINEQAEQLQEQIEGLWTP